MSPNEPLKRSRGTLGSYQASRSSLRSYAHAQGLEHDLDVASEELDEFANMGVASQRIGAAGPHSRHGAVVEAHPYGSPRGLRRGAIRALGRILEEEWDDDDFRRNIPAGYRGSREDTLHEYILSHPKPGSLLIELGRRRLLHHARTLGVHPASLADADVEGVAAEILRHLGFPVPTAPDYSFRESIEDALRFAAEVRWGDIDRAVGAFTLGAQEIEAVLRANSVTWSKLCVRASWKQPLAEALHRTSGKTNGLTRLSLGDWKSIFCMLPAVVADRDDLRPRMLPRVQEYARALKKTKSVEKLDALVSARNDVAHRVDELRRNPIAETRSRLADPLHAAAELLSELRRREILPSVVQPVEERRDPYGRRTIRVLTEGSVAVEMFSPHEIDLSSPYIWLPRLTNPRDINPELMRFTDVMDGL
jgi:hypothetical protein